MKNVLFACLWLFVSAVSVHAQQSKFLDPAKNKSDAQYNSSTVFIDPNNSVKPGEVSSETEHLVLELALDPESTDEVKAQYIRHILTEVEKIKDVHAGFTMITVQVGEQIFLTKAEVAKIGDSYKKRAKANMAKAWETLGAPLQKQFPKATIYGFNWNW